MNRNSIAMPQKSVPNGEKKNALMFWEHEVRPHFLRLC